MKYLTLISILALQSINQTLVAETPKDDDPDEDLKVRLEYGISAGCNLSFLDFKGSIEANLVETDFPHSADPTGGLFLKVMLPTTSGRLMFHPELFYTAYETSAENVEYDNPTYYKSNTYTLGTKAIEINALVRYRIFFDKSHIFINAGLSNESTFEYKNQRILFTWIPTHEEIREYPDLNDVQRTEFGIEGCLGAVYGKFSLEFRYEKSNGISPYIEMASPNEVIQHPALLHPITSQRVILK